MFPLTQLNKPGIGQIFSQVIFPGDHSDIGGGWEKDRNLLSIAPLLYIWGAGLAAGTPFGPIPTDVDYQLNFTHHDYSGNWMYVWMKNSPRNFKSTWDGTQYAPVWTGILH
jgi:hypothetical protein